jgi:MSHA biogenesis protein MshO
MAAVNAIRQTHQRGFTLVELIMVIVIMGVVGGMVSVFMKSPIDAYISGGRRAALTDTADTTVRRMARDLHRALPNSLRPCPSGVNGVEFIPTKTGGRYRTEERTAGDNTSLNFNALDSTFNMLGDNNDNNLAVPDDQLIKVGDTIVVYNLNITRADAYNGDNTSDVVAPKPARAGSAPNYETTITIAGKQFPLASASNRFQVVPAAEKMVSYVCGTNTRTLYRTASTTLTPTASCPTSGAKIATNVDCDNTSFSISDSGNALSRSALVSMRLTLQDSSATESVTLQHEVHVDNTP